MQMLAKALQEQYIKTPSGSVVESLLTQYKSAPQQFPTFLIAQSSSTVQE